MGFISLVFIGIFLIFMIIGIIEFLIAFIIFLTRFIKKKRNARVGKVSKIAAIILVILGVLSEIPFVLVLATYGVSQIIEARDYSELPNKYQVGTEYLEDEFVYQGNTLGNILYKTDKFGKKIEGILLSDEGAAYIKERIAFIE